MNEEQFNALCEACDQLLLAKESGNERIAISWLHVIRAHPIFLDGYREIFVQQTGFEAKRYIRNLASMLRHLGKSLAMGEQFWSSVGELPQECDVLMVSHLLNNDFPGQEGDFYFGRAPCELEEQGINTTIALINYTETSPATLAKRWSKTKIHRVIFTPVLSLTNELALYRRALSEALRLKDYAARSASDLFRSVAFRASLEATSGSTVSALRLGEQIKALVSRLRPRAIVITFEGHSWERIAFAAARAVLPEIRCIGYQHAALFNLQHAIQRRLSDEYNPDVILTSGSVWQTQLKKNPQLKDVIIKVLGSNRSFARQTANTSGLGEGKKRACLVLPEGYMGECNLLFGFALQCARLMPDMKFIWRLHPNMNFEALNRQNPVFRVLPSNIELSAHSLAHDIDRSQWALYRGSTAIVPATVSGLRPVYLHQAGEIPIDTLCGVAELHAQVVEPNDFKKLVTEAGVAAKSLKAEQLQDYCEQMFTPMNTRVLATCITGAQIGSSEVL